MTTELSGPPVFSTPDSHILSEVEPPTILETSRNISDEQLIFRYEIERTLSEARRCRWRRLALQFPDHMLQDSVRVYQLLARGLQSGPSRGGNQAENDGGAGESSGKRVTGLSIDEFVDPVKITILGDTSYGSCCVDEIAAEHVDADAVIHYGRACLSPTARLPVLYVFTQRELDRRGVCDAFQTTFPDLDSKVIVTADTPFASHVELIASSLLDSGYSSLFAASIIHDPSSLIPNRTLPEALKTDPSQSGQWHLFHISEPPTSLLLTLSSCMKGVHVYPTRVSGTERSLPHQANTSILLRRRYALVTSLSTVSTWGILINTLSVKNYLHIVEHMKRSIADAGKKSYLFVVGKLNPAKVANFSEIGGWVVVGCWESSLVDSKDFFKPIITPFELDLVLQGDDRIWTGQWRGNFQEVLDHAGSISDDDTQPAEKSRMPGGFDSDDEGETVPHNWDSEEESAPPEFDLRTGRYVSHSRPMQSTGSGSGHAAENHVDKSTSALTRRAKGDVVAVNGVASPGAQFLAQKRTWRGLGSDLEIRYDEAEEEEQGSVIEEGRTGVARGYAVGASTRS